MPIKKKADVSPKALDPRFLAVLKGLAKDKRYDETMEAYAEAQRSGRKCFGSDALRADGKIFAMIDSRGGLCGQTAEGARGNLGRGRSLRLF